MVWQFNYLNAWVYKSMRMHLFNFRAEGTIEMQFLKLLSALRAFENSLCAYQVV